MSGATTPSTPRAVDDTWRTSEDLGDGRRLLVYADGRVAFEHVCDRGERGVIVCAPQLQIGAGHTLTRDEVGRPTVRASVMCDDCGTHGFVTAGRWEPA
ncbi:hypothetical protein [Nocardioides sp. R-C-SC26]|uniref:hypothetical protein n=1 Tax=Nocardioides sp. R-C-SC26 TaxID=2870414 RepID=UPI001E37B6DB|nr:hypothetical protein [Nocardioides sp. R-C-SC26]